MKKTPKLHKTLIKSKSPKTKNFYKNLEQAIRIADHKKNAPKYFTLGEIIVRLRKERKISAVNFCSGIKHVSTKTLNAIERGRIKNPSLKVLQSIAGGFGIMVSDLFRFCEMGFDKSFYVGNPEELYEVSYEAAGVRVYSSTPPTKEFFYGKVMLGARKTLDDKLFRHPFPIYIAVVLGRLEAELGSAKFELKVGENLFFNGILPYSFYNPSEREALFIIVTAPSFL